MSILCGCCDQQGLVCNSRHCEARPVSATDAILILVARMQSEVRLDKVPQRKACGGQGTSAAEDLPAPLERRRASCRGWAAWDAPSIHPSCTLESRRLRLRHLSCMSLVCAHHVLVLSGRTGRCPQL